MINCASIEDLQSIAELHKIPKVSEYERALARKIAEVTSEVLSALDVSPLRKLDWRWGTRRFLNLVQSPFWLTKVHRAFEGRSLLEMLRLDRLSEILVEARAIGVEQ